MPVGARRVLVSGRSASGSGFSLTAPVLTWTSAASDTTPEFNVDLVLPEIDDVITLQWDDNSDFSSPISFDTNTVDSGEKAALLVNFVVGVLAAGTYYFRAKHARGGTSSEWSAGVTVTISAAITTWNSADKHADITLSGVDLITTRANTADNFRSIRAIASHSTGKYYYEVTINVINGGAANNSFGIANSTMALTQYVGGDNNAIGILQNAVVALNNTNVGTGTAFTAGDTIGIAVDMDNKKIWFRKGSGIWNNNGANDPATNTGGISFATMAAGPWLPTLNHYTNGDKATANFGGTAYAASAPSGFGNW